MPVQTLLTLLFLKVPRWSLGVLASKNNCKVRMGTNFKTGVPLNAQSREVIYNVHNYFTEEAMKFKLSHNRHFNAIQKRCASALGISKTSLNRLLSERFQVPEPGKRIRKINGRRGKSHVRFCDMVNKVFVYLSMECEKFKSVENGYFENVEDRVVNATGICRSLLLKILKGKENGLSKLIGAKLDSPKKMCDSEDVSDINPIENSSIVSTFGSSKLKSAKLDSPQEIFDNKDVSPIEISSSESDYEIEVSDIQGFSVLDYVLT